MPSQQRSEETRTRLLEAAMESFARYGYDATGVAEICRRAGVSKGAFYHHFPSKQAVFLELLNRWLEGLDRQLNAIRAQGGTILEQFVRMAGMARQIFQTASGQLPIFLEFWTQAAHDPAIWQATIAPYRRYRAYFARMIETGIAEGSLRPVDSDTAAQVIVSVAVGLLLQGLLDPHGIDWGKTVEASIEMILDNLKKRE